jgi:exosortase
MTLILRPEATLEPPAAGMPRWEWLLSATLLVVGAGITFSPVMTVLMEQWATNDTYSFGVLVPFISGYFVWMQRDRLARMTITPSPWVGSVLVGLCAALLAFGRAIGVIGVQEIAMVLIVPASVWLLFGRRYVFALWFPLLYLLLMLPIWEILTDRFHYRFQLFSAGLGENLLSVAGVPVHRNETYLQLPNITLEVASVCSGVNFLVAVLAIGVPQAYLFLRGLMPRAVVIGFAVAIAVLSNGLRIAIIGVLSHYELSEQIHGPGHILQGLFVSGAGLIALQMAIGFMARRYPNPRLAAKPAEPIKLPLAAPRWRLMAVAAAVSILIFGAGNFQPSELAAASISSAALDTSLEMSTWRSIATPRAMPVVQGGPSLNIGRTFRSAAATLDLFAGDLAYVEITGGLGYRAVTLPTRAALSQTPIQTREGAVGVNTVSFRDGDAITEVAYWYELNGTVTSQVTTAKLGVLWGLLTGKRPMPLLIVVVRTQSADAQPDSEPFERVVAEVFEAMQRRLASLSSPENSL